MGGQVEEGSAGLLEAPRRVRFEAAGLPHTVGLLFFPWLDIEVMSGRQSEQPLLSPIGPVLSTRFTAAFRVARSD